MRRLSEGQDLGQELAERNGGFVRPIVISVVMIARGHLQEARRKEDDRPVAFGRLRRNIRGAHHDSR